MPTSHWQLEDNRASLLNSSLQASFDLAQPQQGLTNFASQPDAAVGLRPLAISLPDGESLASALSESYIRTEDLVAVYEESPARPFRTQVYWRAISPGADGKLRGGVDLIASVNTSGLDVLSDATIDTELPEGDLLVSRDVESAHFNPIEGDGEAMLFEAGGPAIFLFRPRDADWSYAEMFHPADFSAAEVLPAGPHEPARLSHSLFKRRMEKGVIVRSRMRAVLLTRDDDEATAVGCFRELEHAKLPLTV